MDDPDSQLRFYEKDSGGMISKDQSCIYFVGIIDILTEYKYAIIQIKALEKGWSIN